MVNKAVCFFLFRIVLPFALIAAIICRQNVLSFVYLLLLLGAPVVPLPSAKSMAGHTGRYLKAVLGYSILATVAQIVFQVVLLSLPPYGDILRGYEFLETLLRHLGFQRYDKIDPLQAARLIGPEALMLIVSSVVYIPCIKMAEASGPYKSPDGTSDSQLPLTEAKVQKRRRITILSTLGDGIAMALLASAGIIRPSITSATYFLAFLAVATWVSCDKKLRRGFAMFRIFLLVFAALHLIVLYIYQMPISHELIQPESLYARLFGLTNMVKIDQNDPRNIQFLSLEWATYVNPALLLALYWVLVMETKLWLRMPHIVDDGKSFPGEGAFPFQQSDFPPLFAGTLTPPVHYTHPHNTPRSSMQVSQYRLRRTKSEKPPSMSRRGKSIRRKPTAKRTISFENSREATPLLSADGASRHYSTVEGSGEARHNETENIEIDPNGSVILSNIDTDAPTSEDPRQFPMSRIRQLLAPLMSIFMLITRQSYIATLIVMMAYSITYHSWLTFVLLLWSCILWMMPSSRKACLRSSPALVMYAEALLIIQYIYGMSLTDAELPQKIDEVNLTQIGLVKYSYLPCLPLAVKVLYTVMFWITLRQYMEERFQEKNRKITDGVLMQPVKMAYSTAQAGTQSVDVQRQISVQSSPFMKKLGDFVLSVLTTYWIWVVACMLMVISLQGDKVVIFRIMYMALFLSFILTFQLSYNFWRSAMYFFWLTVIIYSMLVLILIYTYQFEYFKDYWSDYIGISEKLQRDIGLEVFDTGQLFLKLLQPTFFVVITIIQLHYFHKDFLRISDIDRNDNNRMSSPQEIERTPTSEHAVTIATESGDVKPSTRVDIDGEGDGMGEVGSDGELVNPRNGETNKPCGEQMPVIIGIPSTPTGDEPPYKEVEYVTDEQKTKDSADAKPSSWKDTLLRHFKMGAKHVVKIYNTVSEFLWRFLEIHMIKIVLFAALMLAVYDVCVIHVIFVVLVTAALPFRPIQLIVSHCCAIWSSVLLISKMIYQIDYVEEAWVVNCTDVQYLNESLPLPYPFNDTVNNAHWMGFHKVVDLPDYLKGYIGLILVLSIQAVVRVRQNYHRNQTDAPDPKPGVLFTDIDRTKADLGLKECLKYLVNYAFYKFGVEICLMTNVAVIGVRLDIFALIYSLWLGGMFLLKRTTLARVWPFYVSFLAILLPIQYCMCVGMPPGFCIEYPWSVTFMHAELREWLYLPDFAKPLAAYKLAVDFFLLLFACCQLFVFQVEVSPMAESYEGGSNREIIYMSADEHEKNPIPDFVTNTTSYLDSVKVIIFSLFYWLTLAIIFLAGTNRVSLFAMGYVIGCFLFLWNGQEFYLKPLKSILRLWNMLLAYNIFVIFTKTILQMIGCVYITEMLNHFCWAIQLFGIACIKKFEKGYATVTKMGECTVPEDEAGLLWDGICLAFMLMQRRLFCSYYFHHLVTEMHAQTKLASRGAELINQLLMKEVSEQETAEREIVEKIKKKMDRIRANQRKIRGKEYSEAQEHFQASDLSSASTPMYSMGTPSSSHPTQPTIPVGEHSEDQIRPSALHFPVSHPSLPPSALTHSRSRHSSRRHHSSRRRRRRHRRRSADHGGALSPSPPPPPHPHPASPTGGGPPSPGSAACTFSLDGYLEPPLSMVGTSAPFYQALHHPSSNIGVATPSEESFPFFSPPPYLAATANSSNLLHRPGTPHSNLSSTNRRSLHLNLNHVSHHYQSDSAPHQPHHLSAAMQQQPPSIQPRPSSTSPPSALHPLLSHQVSQSQFTPRSSVIGLAPTGSIRRSYSRRQSNPSSPAFSHHNSIRSGDYFMFEEYSDDGLAELDYQEKKSDEKEEDPGGMTVSKLLSSAMKSDIKHAVSEAKQVKGSQSPDTGASRHTSSDVSGRPPVSRTVSAVSGASSLPVGMSVSRQASLRSQGYAELEHPPAFPSMRYDDYGGGDGRESRSPPLPELEGALKVPHGDTEDEEDQALEGDQEEENLYRKIINWLKFAWAFIEGILVSSTLRLNVISKDYRYVARCLAKEKKLLKEKGLVSAQSLRGEVSEPVNTSPPTPPLHSIVPTYDEPLEIRVEKASEDQTNGSMECLDTPEQLEKEFEKDQPVPIRFAIALWYAMVSRSEIVCYVMIVINQIKSAGMVSLPLPFMAFLWGSLSIPRPTKSFWITIITYTEAIVVVKYLFQFDFFPWNDGDPRVNNPFFPPRIIGVEKKEQYAVYDLLLLLVIFFHRFILKSLGLWKDDSDSAQSVDSIEEGGGDSKSTDERSIKKSIEDVPRSVDDFAAREEEEYEEEYEEEKPVSRAVLDCVLTYTQPFKHFFHNLFHPSYRVTVDVYAFMFLCDFATFLILVFGYWAFGTGGGDDGVASYFEENKVPVPFLVMLIAQFGLIIIDRALFLRKFILGKVIFQVVMVFIVHLWMFFVLPSVTERDFNSSLPPQLWYLVKCIYLLLSAYQIRSGYPTRILGNFLTKKYNYLNQFLFRGFMAIPFLFELRALMDWIWTDTSMSLSSWLKMEDIFANIFILKCQRRAESEYPTPRGEKRKPLIKYGVGGLILFVIIFIIWFPLVLFALGNTVGIPNPPFDVTVEITFGGYQPLFKMSAQHNSLMPYTQNQYNNMVYYYRKQRDAAAFLQNYDERDIVIAELSGNSTAVWGISPPSQQQLIEDLMSNNRITLKFAWHVSRNSTSPDVMPTVGDEMAHVIQPNDPIRQQFALMLNGTTAQTQNPIVVRNFFPKFIRVPGRGKSTYLRQLLKDQFGKVQFSNLTMSLRTGGFLNESYEQQWWEIREECDSSIKNQPIKKDCDYLRVITVSDKVFPSTLSILSGYGIVGMYTTLVLLASRFVRSLFAGVSFHIMFDDMPYVDRVLQLCLDIYLVRESNELHLEEDLFAKLIFLYRSPETLIKWTRYPQSSNSP